MRGSNGLAILGDVALVLFGLVGAFLVTFLAPGSPIRVAAALVVLLLLPGYALTTVAFPASRHRSPDLTEASTRSSPPDSATANGAGALAGYERAALSFGLSIALLPLFGIVLESTAGRYRLAPALTIVTGFVLLALAAGVIRRLRVPAERRYVFPLREWFGGVSVSAGGSSGLDVALNVVLAIALVASMSTLAFALVAPQDGSEFTEVYLLAEQDDGELAAKNYPTDFERGEGRSLAFAVGNHEAERQSYTVIVQLQRLNEANDVVESVELNRFQGEVDAGKTWREVHTVEPTLIGEQLQLTYLVYRGSPPSEIDTGTAYRQVSIRIDVTSSVNGGAAADE